MRLRQRLVLTFLVIALLLAAPTVYGFFALSRLQSVADTLQTRDAVGALALGRLQAAFQELESQERVYVALAGSSDPESRIEARQQLAESAAQIEQELENLSEGGYAEAAANAVIHWARLQAVLAQQQQMVDSDELQRVLDEYRPQQVNPAFAAMDSALDPISTAINLRGQTEVQQARNIADTALTTILLGLAAALAIALAIGTWSAHAVLRPIEQLRRAMRVVAGGDFEPDLPIAPGRPDEIGDLARSFRRMTEQLAALRRLEAEFVSVASHELKTPLSVIKGYVSLLRDGIYGDLDDRQRKVLVSIDDQADRLGRLIRQLLDISRFEAGGGRLEIKPFPLRDFLADLATSFEVLAYQSDIDFQSQLSDDLPELLEGDADRLNEVVGNLLSNAFKFTPRQGQIRLCARRGSRSTNEGIVIEVADSGVGIPQEQLPRIFEKFFQVENEAQPRSVGSGLGLAISREIVEAHGGTISAESQVGEGTTFQVFLPLRPPVHEAA